MRCQSCFQCVNHLVALLVVILLVAVPVETARGVSFYSTKVINTTNPVLYWELDEASGPTAADLSSINGSNTGTYSGSTFGVAGPRPADGFPGMNATNNGSTGGTADEVVISNLQTVGLVGTAAYSAAIWFNSSAAFNSQVLSYVLNRGIDTSTPGRRDAVGVGGSFSGITDSVLFALNGDGVTIAEGSTVLSPNTWYHVVMVRDDSLGSERLKVYLDGDPTPEIFMDDPWFGGTGDYFTAGNRTDTNTTLGLTGTFDEVAVWDYALTPSQVESLYNTAVIGPVPEPSSFAILGLGMFGLMRQARRKGLCRKRN